MSGDSATTRATSTGGDNVYDELIAGGSKVSGSKWHTGSLGVDGGVASLSNPWPIRLPPTATTVVTLIPQVGLLLFSGAGIVFGGNILNVFGGTLYLMLFDATANQADGTAPLHAIALTNNVAATVVFGHPIYGCSCSTGAWLQISSTASSMSTIDPSDSIFGHVTHNP